MLYPELFKQLEAVRWNMETDIPWSSVEPTQLSDEQARIIKMNAITKSLERWLDMKIRFDALWESRVVARLLHNLGLLLNQSFKTVQKLNHYRKTLSRELAAGAVTSASAQSA